MVGFLEAGPAPSRTPARCLARGDVRISPGMTQQTLMRDLRAHLDRLGIEGSVSEIVHQRPYRFAPDAPIVRTLIEAAREATGTAPEISDGLPASAYVTDAPDFMRLGIPTVVYGPGDWKVEPDERIRIDHMLTAARVYALATARIISGEAAIT